MRPKQKILWREQCFTRNLLNVYQYHTFTYINIYYKPSEYAQHFTHQPLESNQIDEKKRVDSISYDRPVLFLILLRVHFIFISFFVTFWARSKKTFSRMCTEREKTLRCSLFHDTITTIILSVYFLTKICCFQSIYDKFIRFHVNRILKKKVATEDYRAM